MNSQFNSIEKSNDFIVDIMFSLYKVWNRKYKWDAIIAIFIFSLPFLVYSHLLIEENYKLAFFLGNEYTDTFDDVRTFVWYLWSKLIPLALMAIWFFTSPFWWRYFILFPLLLFFYSLIRHILNYSNLDFNNVEIFAFSILICCISIFICDTLLFKKLREYEFNISFKRLLLDKNLFYNLKKNLLYPVSHKRDHEENIPVRLYLISERLKTKLYRHQDIAKKAKLTYRKRDVSIALVLFLIPFLFYLFEYIPEGISEFNFLGIKIQANGFNDVNIFIWYVLSKICVLIPLTIWFLTSQNWYRHAILSPIIIYSYQLWEGVKESRTNADEVEYLMAFPYLFALFITLVFLGHLIKYQSKLALLHEQLIIELENLISKMNDSQRRSNKRNQLIEKLRTKINNHYEAEQRLKILQNLRQELIKEINATN